MALLTQLANITSTAVYSSAAVRYVFGCFLQFVASFLSTYLLKASLENCGSLAYVASSVAKWIMSSKSGSLKCLHLILMTFLSHFSLVFPCSFDRNKHIISGVSTRFQFCLDVALSHFSRKL